MTLQQSVADRAFGWMEAGERVVTATIARIRGSSSQPLGSRMAISEGGAFCGFVSGGCVEADVRDRASQVFSDGQPRLLNYQKAGDDPFEIGLNCEGRIDVVLELVSREDIAFATDQAGVHLTAYRETDDDRLEVKHHRLDAADGEQLTAARLAELGVDESAGPSIADCIAWGEPTSFSKGEWHYLVEPHIPPPTLLVVSVSSATYPLSRMGRSLGYRVIISDPRAEYLDPEVFPDAHSLLNVWPRDLPEHITFGDRVYVVSLNHEPRFEDDLFRMLQSQPQVAYLGALGKRRRQTEREERQVESGFDLSLLPPIHTPVGLDLGGKAAEEVALSILAEIQAVRHGRLGGLQMKSGGSAGSRFVDGELTWHDVGPLIEAAREDHGAGAISVFFGRVRADEIDGQTVTALVYEVYKEMAVKTLGRLSDEISHAHGLAGLRVLHSLGQVNAGELCFAVIASAERRSAAIDGCREAVERIKSEVPIYAKEMLSGGGHVWKRNS